MCLTVAPLHTLNPQVRGRGLTSGGTRWWEACAANRRIFVTSESIGERAHLLCLQDYSTRQADSAITWLSLSLLYLKTDPYLSEWLASCLLQALCSAATSSKRPRLILQPYIAPATIPAVVLEPLFSSKYWPGCCTQHCLEHFPEHRFGESEDSALWSLCTLASNRCTALLGFLACIETTKKALCVAHTYNPSTWEW